MSHSLTFERVVFIILSMRVTNPQFRLIRHAKRLQREGLRTVDVHLISEHTVDGAVLETVISTDGLYFSVAKVSYRYDLSTSLKEMAMKEEAYRNRLRFKTVRAADFLERRFGVSLSIDGQPLGEVKRALGIPALGMVNGYGKERRH
jgi:hypothetical protein